MPSKMQLDEVMSAQEPPWARGPSTGQGQALMQVHIRLQPIGAQ